MNTVAWLMMTRDGGRSIWALHGDVALYAGFDQTEVWMSAPGRDEAERYLVTQTAKVEEKGSRLVSGPVEFDLTPEAIATIQRPDQGRWVHAPLLSRELTLGVQKPVHPGGITAGRMPTIVFHTTAPSAPSVGAMWYDSSTSALRTFTGTGWVEVAPMPVGTIGIELD